MLTMWVVLMRTGRCKAVGFMSRQRLELRTQMADVAGHRKRRFVELVCGSEESAA